MSVDLGPATTDLSALLDGVADHDLARRTPCGEWNVGDLLDHVMGLALAFTGAARAEQGSGAPPSPPHGTHLPDDWRVVLPARLGGLAAAWSHADADKGKASVGGVELPKQVHRMFCLDELIGHGWDLAVATGQSIAPEESDLEALQGFLTEFREHNDVPPELFGEPVELPDTAPLLDRVLALTGRDPAWS